MTNPIDEAHCDLIYGLTVSLKPRSILELGYGEGRSLDALWRAIEFNRQPATYVLLDNWSDYEGLAPDWLVAKFAARSRTDVFGSGRYKAEILTMDEAQFWAQNKLQRGSYDLILSDADHGNADQTFDIALATVNPGGLLIYHDVSNPNHKNLANIILKARVEGYPTLLFNQSSRPDEQCQRGLAVISI